MNPPPNREVALFSAALELPAGQRTAYLDEACADDPVLRQRIEALLRVHEEAISFLENPAPGAQQSPSAAKAPGGTMRLPALPTEKAGDHIGRYKLLQEIGEGGCGVVYMAEQEQPVRRRVAVKVIKLGMDTKQVIARFEAERQALALMDHPHIAKVLDAGATETGRPYFIMELVRGIKITDYCDQENLSTEKRLNLFIQVCQAVQHAHQKGIIHRDIKPSNILVADHDGVPVPKVIDFGVAKATTDQRLTDKTLFTAFEQFIGTPAYMSPEQARLSGLDIDTRTDIYSLGVLLYELLTGKTPLDQKELLAAGLDEMRRTIREREPLRPSTRLSQELVAADVRRLKSSARAKPATEEEIRASSRRLLQLKQLIPMIRGDLDWIVMKCLEKDRGRRYETANGLAMDVQRHLADEPVTARPPSKIYRFQKLARRNKLVFAAGSVVFVALVAGLAVSTWFYLREMAARLRAVAAEQKAVSSEKKAQAINKFLTEDLLFQATPEQNAREKKITMEEVLTAATRRLDQSAEMTQQPEVEATLRLAVGRTYLKLSELADAERNLRRAFTLRRSVLGPQNLDTLAAENKLGELLMTAGKFEDAEPVFREAWRGRQQLLGDTNRDTLDSLEGCEIVLQETGHLPEAERLARQILQTSERALGPDDSITMDALRNLSGVASQLGDYAEAERLNREALTRSRRTANREQELWSINQIAVQRLLQGDPEQADKLLAEAVPPAVREFGPDNFVVLWTQRIWARALADEGRLDQAEALIKSTLALKRLTPDKLGTCRTAAILGRILVEEGKLDEAEPYLREAQTYFQEHPNSRNPIIAQAANWLGAIQVARKAYPEAETLVLSGSDQVLSPGSEMSPNEVRLAIGHIIGLYKAWGKPEQAATWQKKLDGLAKSPTKP
jgi:serine/threonine protein kinase